MKILVTGGAGFIGRHLVKGLIEDRHHVVVFDNLSNSSEKMLSFISGKFSFVKADITDYKQILGAVSGVDLVIHLAAIISVRDSVNNPEKTRRVNVTGTENLIKACVKNNVKNLIAVSSAAVYGDLPSAKDSLNERSQTKPTSPYGKSKLEMEDLVKQYSAANSINSVILRFFNVYGPGQSGEYAGVISKFAQNIKEERPLLIYGDGLQTRDFVNIQDVIDLIYHAISRMEGKQSSIYNIASGKSVTIQYLAEVMNEVSGKNLDIQYERPRESDIRYSQTDISLARKELDYCPKIELRDGIKNLLRYYSMSS